MEKHGQTIHRTDFMVMEDVRGSAHFGELKSTLNCISEGLFFINQHFRKHNVIHRVPGPCLALLIAMEKSGVI